MTYDSRTAGKLEQRIHEAFTARAFVSPIALHDPTRAQDESESELPITRVTLDPVLHRHHWRRRWPRALSISPSRFAASQACAARHGTTASAIWSRYHIASKEATSM
jgi:hypothetical protein